MSKSTESTDEAVKSATAAGEPAPENLDFDRWEVIATEKEAGVLYVAEDPEFTAAGQPWKVLLTNPRAPSVQRRTQFLEKKWRRENNYKKLTYRTPYDIIAKLTVQAVIELAVVHVYFGWKSKGKSLLYDTWRDPQTLPAARKLLVDVASRIEKIAEFFSEAIVAFTEHGDSEEDEGEG